MIQFTKAQVEKYRELIQKVAVNLADDEAAYVPLMFERWESDKDYPVGKRLCYQGKLYKVLIKHTSQATWTPDLSPSLFADVLIPDPTVIPEWVQPGSTNPYMKGDKVRHNGSVWESIVENNVWEPGVYGWDEVQ
jgi:hypothetical protein